jgi:hypothetical protein
VPLIVALGALAVAPAAAAEGLTVVDRKEVDAGDRVTLLSNGNFKVTGECVDNGGGDYTADTLLAAKRNNLIMYQYNGDPTFDLDFDKADPKATSRVRTRKARRRTTTARTTTRTLSVTAGTARSWRTASAVASTSGAPTARSRASSSASRSTSPSFSPEPERIGLAQARLRNTGPSAATQGPVRPPAPECAP